MQEDAIKQRKNVPYFSESFGGDNLPSTVEMSALIKKQIPQELILTKRERFVSWMQKKGYSRDLEIVNVCISIGFSIMYIADSYFTLCYASGVEILDFEYTTVRIVNSIDIVLSMVFASFFLFHLYTTKNRIRYLMSIFSIIDYVTVIPVLVMLILTVANPTFLALYRVGVFRLLRLFRVLTMVRLIKQVGKLQNTARRVLVLAMTIIAELFLFAGTIQVIENLFGAQYLAYHDSIYMMFVTLVTIGYGDLAPKAVLSKMLIIVFFAISSIILPYQISNLLQILKEPRRYLSVINFLLVNHVVVTGTTRYNDVLDFVKEFFNEQHGRTKVRKLLLVFESQELCDRLRPLVAHPFYRDSVSLFCGDIKDMAVLQMLRVERAASVFILANKTVHPHQQDYNTLVTTIAVKNVNPQVQVHCQILLPESRISLLQVGADVIVGIYDLKMKITSMGLLVPGFTTLVSNLIHSVTIDDPISEMAKCKEESDHWMYEYLDGLSHELYRIKFSPYFIDKSFIDVSEFVFTQFNITIFAIGRDKKLLLNPGKRLVENGDFAICMARNVFQANKIFFYENPSLIKGKKMMSPPVQQPIPERIERNKDTRIHIPAHRTVGTELEGTKQKLKKLFSFFHNSFTAVNADEYDSDELPEDNEQQELKEKMKQDEIDNELQLEEEEANHIERASEAVSSDCEEEHGHVVERPPSPLDSKAEKKLKSPGASSYDVKQKKRIDKHCVQRLLRTIAPISVLKEFFGYQNARSSKDFKLLEKKFYEKAMDRFNLTMSSRDKEDFWISCYKVKDIKDHILVLGSLRGATYISLTIRSSRLHRRTPIIFMSPDAEHYFERMYDRIRFIDDIYFMKGSTTDRIDLRRAGFHVAKTALYLMRATELPNHIKLEPKQVNVPTDQDGSSIKGLENEYYSLPGVEKQDIDDSAECDAEAIKTVLALQWIDRSKNSVIEVNNRSNVRFLKPNMLYDSVRRANIDKLLKNVTSIHVRQEELDQFDRFSVLTPMHASGRVFTNNTFARLLCQTFYNPIVVMIIEHMCGFGGWTELTGSSIFMVKCPSGYEGKTYLEIYQYFIEKEMVVMGLYRHTSSRKTKLPFVYTCPRRETIVFAQDRLYIVGDEEKWKQVEEEAHTD